MTMWRSKRATSSWSVRRYRAKPSWRAPSPNSSKCPSPLSTPRCSRRPVTSAKTWKASSAVCCKWPTTMWLAQSAASSSSTKSTRSPAKATIPPSRATQRRRSATEHAQIARRLHRQCAPQGGRKHPDQDYIQVDTHNILFICGGAFDGIEKKIAPATQHPHRGLRFGAKQKEDRHFRPHAVRRTAGSQILRLDSRNHWPSAGTHLPESPRSRSPAQHPHRAEKLHHEAVHQTLRARLGSNSPSSPRCSTMWSIARWNTNSVRADSVRLSNRS